MPPAPTIEASETDAAIEKLTAYGGDHADLVDRWGSGFGENLAYAKDAFRQIVTDRPDIIAKVDAAGLGDDPAILHFLATHGRLAAGFSGDFTVARSSEPTPFQNPARVLRTSPSRGGSAAQRELDEIMENSPPGSEAYRQPATQRRVEALHRQIAGNAPPIGRGGRVV